MFEHADPHLVQVSQEAIEDWHEVRHRDLFTEDHSQFMDGERERSSHFPLQKQNHCQRRASCYYVLPISSIKTVKNRH